ncbi:hypothetical protein MBAV_001974 [Candidatus Magnetobacterium bavaricum]|uniref:Uncharacterized protein n=1 Tax=Candidatus Magnetobacterium bavaricum TaxID=29290 RepID=A0A0F3GVC7_9BACT|nr:hypothetical protein MBAV_001974 [Candidatus Magnetobacterium bavaricum]
MDKKIRKKQAPKDSKTAYSLCDEEEMAVVIMKYAKPLFENAEDLETSIKVIRIAIFCWRLSFFSKETQEEVIETFFKANSINSDGQEEMKPVFKFLLDRKSRYFSKIKTDIADYQLREKGDGFELNLTLKSQNS